MPASFLSIWHVDVFAYLQGGTAGWPSWQSHELNELGGLNGEGPSQDDAPAVDLPAAMKMLRPPCNSIHGVSPCHRAQVPSQPVMNDRKDVLPYHQNVLTGNFQERELLLGTTVRYERLRMHHIQQIHHTPGIHFDKHSLRWKATWYDISGHRKAKYFPIGELQKEPQYPQPPFSVTKIPCSIEAEPAFVETEANNRKLLLQGY